MIEMFFDYTCPYCYKDMKDIWRRGLQLNYRPIETHPLPEPAKVYTFLAACGYYVCVEKEGQVDTYNQLVMTAHFEQGRRIDDPSFILSALQQAGAQATEADLNRYSSQVLANNRLGWMDLGLESVPSYRIDGQIRTGSGQVDTL